MIVTSPNPFLRWPAPSLGVTLLLGALLALRWFSFEVSTESTTLLAGDQRSLTTYQEVRRMLNDDLMVVINMHSGPVFTRKSMDAIRRVSEAFTRQPGLLDVKSFTHSLKPVRRGLSFELVPLVSENPTETELAALRRFSLANPLIRNVMFSTDEQNCILLNTYRRDLSQPEAQSAFRDEIDRILAPFRTEGYGFSVLALPLIEAEIRQSLRTDTLRFLPTALAIVAAILWLTFRAWRMVLLVGLNQLLLLLLLPALVQLLGCQLNVFNVMFIPLLAAIHLTLLIHLVHTWTQTATQHPHPHRALDAAIQTVLPPSLFAALTTTAGFLSLLASDVRVVRETGLLGAAGVALAFALTFGPCLATIRLFGRQPTPAPAPANPLRAASSALGPAWRPFLLYHPQGILVATLLALTAAAWGLTRLRTDVRPAEFLSPQSPTRQAVELINARYGGVNVVQIEVDAGRDNAINTLPFLRYLESVERFAATQPEVSGAYSYAQLLAMMNQIWQNEAPDSFRLPDNALTLNFFVLALKAYPSPFLTALADDTSRKAFLIVRTPDMPARRYLDVLHRIVDFARDHQPEGVQVSAAKGMHSILEADQRILRSLTNTAGITLLCLALMLLALWRSVSLTCLALGTTIVAVLLALGFAGLLGLPLNSITVMTAAISLGMAVDHSIHFLTHYRHARQTGLSPEDALELTFEAKSRPILTASLILLAVFLVFRLSSFPPVVDFGLLAAGTFAAALLTALGLLPVLLQTLSCRTPDAPRRAP